MSTKIAPKSVSVISPEIQFLSFIKDFSAQLNQDAVIGIELSKSNVHNELSKIVSNTIQDPIGNVIDGLAHIEKSILYLLDQEITNHFKAHLKTIESVFRINEGVLHYTLILKEDTLLNRAIIQKYLLEYNKHSYSSRFPITLQFVPKGFKKSLPKDKKLSI